MTEKRAQRKKKIAGLDFARAICAMGIITYHVSCYSSEQAHKILYTYAGGSGGFGVLLVGIFLIISGGVLYYNYGTVDSLKVFYYKRWRAVFPMFYLAFSAFFLAEILMEGKDALLKAPFVSILFSLFGMDGYFLYRFPTYYIIGEWFLGAIVFLYLLYPLYAWLVKKLDYKVLLIMIPIWIWQIKTDVFQIETTWNLIYCSGVFVLGMLLFKHNLHENRIIRIVSILVTAMLIWLPVENLYQLRNITLMITSLITLMTIGEFIAKVPKLGKVVSFVGGLTFPMFLVQNKVGVLMVRLINPVTKTEMLITVCAAIMLCICVAWCLKLLTDYLLMSKWFRAVEGKILEVES